MAIGRERSAEVHYRPAERIQRRPIGRLALHGIVGGLIAGIIFAMFEMVVAALLEGRMKALWNPLRMIAAMALGEEAMAPSYSLAKAAVTGMVVHMMLSAAFGLAFALLVVAVPVLTRSVATLVAAATAYGLLLRLVNFYVIAPVAGWDWFPEKASQFWQGFVAHTFFFGTVLGTYLAATRAGRAAGA